MKLPNGYGCISKLSGNRRKPYMIRKGCDIIGYAPTRAEALAFLAEYNKEPWDVDLSKATFSDVYDLFMKHKKDQVCLKTVNNYKSKYLNCCQPLYKIPYKDLRLHHFTSIIDNYKGNAGSKKNLRSFFRAMDRTAYEFDIISKQYTEMIPTPKVEYKEKQPFTEAEIDLLWKNLDVPDVDLVLILIYTGLRSGELDILTVENIDLENRFLKCGIKTEAGKNRLVPIHERIVPLLQKRIDEAGSGLLLSYRSKQFRIRFKRVMEKLYLKHTPHECRHTLRTRLDNLDANKVCIDLILGHKSESVGERVYTHKTKQQLLDTIDQLS